MKSAISGQPDSYVDHDDDDDDDDGMPLGDWLMSQADDDGDDDDDRAESHAAAADSAPATREQLAHLAFLTSVLAQVEGLQTTVAAISGKTSSILQQVRSLPTAPQLRLKPRPLPATAPASPPASPFLTLAEAAEYCRMSKGTLYNALYHGKLSKQPGTRKVLFTRQALDAFLSTKPKRRR